MALTRLAAFATGTVLTSSQLTTEFDNIYNNSLTLISPLTGNLSFGGFNANNIALGSAAAPSINWTGNTNTGFFSAAANQVGIAVAGVAAANFTAAAAGPHVVGSGTTNTRYAFLHTGTITLSGATQEAGIASDQALTNASGVNLYGVYLTQTLTNVAGATTTMAWLTIAPSALTITAGSVTNAAGLYITAAPSGATNNLAVWVAGGATRLDGLFGVGSAGPSSNFKIDLGSAGGEAFTSAATLTTAWGYVSIRPASVAPTSGTGDGYFLSVANGGPNLNPTGASTNGDTLVLTAPGKGGAGTFTNMSTLRIASAPTGGTNNYALWVAAGTVRWDNGIALGAAANATLGATGGSGPATTTQNQWLRVNIAGTVNFIPVWQ